MPFSQKSLDFIRNLDIKADIELLQQHLFFRPQCLRNMRISATLLKFGALAGLTLAQIGSILCRPDDDDSKPSQLETLVHKTSVMAAKSRQGEICCPSELEMLFRPVLVEELPELSTFIWFDHAETSCWLPAVA